MHGSEGRLSAFASVVSGDDEDIDLAVAALLIAKSEYRNLDVRHYVSRIGALAETLQRRVARANTVPEQLQELNGFLFHEQGFSGNVRHYSDPRNSFLNEVLERRVGIPISLSVLYMEVGQRVGLPLVGVSFPGHFLVKLSVDAGDIVLDPFLGGLSLSREDLENRLQVTHEFPRGQMPEVDQLLGPASKREVLLRMLRNLKMIYLRAEDSARALNVMNHMLCLAPDDAREVRDRGLILQGLECFRAASEDYQRYLELAPDADDVEEVRGRFIETYRSGQRLH